MTIMELIEQETGIIIYDLESKSVAAVSFGQCGEDQILTLDPFGIAMMPWPMSEGWADGVQRERVKDWRQVLPGSVWLTDETDEDGNRIADTDLDIVYDKFYDIARSFIDPGYDEDVDGDYEASVYRLADGTIIIAPDMWQ